MGADRLRDALALLGELAAPEAPGLTTIRFPDGETEVPFGSDAHTVSLVPGRDRAAFEAVLWFGFDDALAAFFGEDPGALALARAGGGAGVGYIDVYVHPTAELEEPLAELTLVARSSSISELFHQSQAFRARLMTLLERVGAHIGLLDLEGDVQLVFWLEGRRWPGAVAVPGDCRSLREFREALARAQRL